MSTDVGRWATRGQHNSLKEPQGEYRRNNADIAVQAKSASGERVAGSHPTATNSGQKRIGMTVGFKTDIVPLFTSMDIEHMS